MKETAMRVWLRLTHLFGLPEGDRSDNLMETALGPVLRAACQDIVDAALPEPIARLVQELTLRAGYPGSPAKPAPNLSPINVGLWVAREWPGNKAGIFRTRKRAIRYLRDENTDGNFTVLFRPVGAAGHLSTRRPS